MIEIVGIEIIVILCNMYGLSCYLSGFPVS